MAVAQPRQGIIFGRPARMSHVPPGRRNEPIRIRGTRWRMPWWHLPHGALVILLAGQVAAQDRDNLRVRWLPNQVDTIALDTLSIVPGSLFLFADGLPVGDARFTLDPYRAVLVWHDRPATDSVLARYRVLPFGLLAVRSHKDPERLYTASGDRPDPFKYTPPRQQGDLMGMQGLNRTGSISRGILFGNNQDLAVNSALNLELSGRITDRIGVLASITDNNIPIQAGGNTLELQDFDQVFIKLYEEDAQRPGNKWELIAGDFVLDRPRSHFLTYLKKTKGLGYGMRYGQKEGPKGEFGTSVAISKGKFARNVVQGIEGVQGPYRLRGNDGELFIVVLSGTERVFIDGQQLVRGQDHDYVIDYNTAEVTFTARRMITKDRRIAVEFQYSDKNYARSMVRADNITELGNTTVRFSLFSEQDHRNQTLQQQLSDEEREALRLAGDDPLSAVVPGIDSTGWAVDQVLYRRVDSLGYSPVFVYSTDPETAVWRLIFTQVGAGNGDYVQQEFTPNGRVFRWVAPDTVNGAVVRQGDHAPVRVLIPPRSQQLITLGVDQRFSRRTQAGVELAFSHLDRNTFSEADNADDQGLGVLLKGEHAIPIASKDTTLQLVLGTEVESITRNFRFVERYRAVEFERNWNLVPGIGTTQDPALDGDQLLAGIRAGIRGRRIGQFHYGLNTLQVGGARYDGWKHDVLSGLRLGRTDVDGTAAWLRTTTPRNSDFMRHKAQVRHRFKHITVGYRDEHEHNRFTDDTTGLLLAPSYRFYDWEAFVQSPDTAGIKWRLSGGQRREQALANGALVASTLADALSAGLDLGRDPRNRLGASFTYRRLTIIDSTVTAQQPEDTWLARLDHNLTLWKGVVVMATFYEFGSGLEQRQEYIYIEVPAGQGLYVWIDYNGDGIKDLNEFELAAFGYEANYLRVFVPSNQYVRVFSNQFSGSLDLRPGVAWAEKEGIRRFLGRFSDMSSFRVDRRTRVQDVLSALDPFGGDVLDTSITSYLASARNTLYYDRTSRVWSMDHTWQNDRSRTLLLNGYESRSRRNNTVRLRLNVTRRWTADVESESGRLANGSDLLAGRTYAIDQRALRPRITWQPNTALRAIVSYKITEKNNEAEFGGERATLRDLGAEFRYNTAGKGSILATANLVDITYDGEVNSSLGNEMLTGLKPGTNITWSVTVQRNLSNNLQVDLTYNGRRSEGVPTIHVGGAQVRAFF